MLTYSIKLFIILFLLPLLSFSQAPLPYTIYLPQGQHTVGELLGFIEQQQPLNLAYSQDDIPLDSPLALTQRQYPVEELLTEISKKNGLRYQINPPKILLFKAKKPATKRISATTYTLSGHVLYQANGEYLQGAAVIIPSLKTGAYTNEYGFFSLSLPADTYRVEVRHPGYNTLNVSIILNKNLQKNFHLPTNTSLVEDVLITAQDENEHHRSLEIGVDRLSISELKALPPMMGEADPLRAVQLLPGVKTISEGSTGFFVRGGGMDQNLILLDEAPVYNPSHLLGFFSVFNADALQGLELYKGSLPARYGGRLSSVMDVRMKEGNAKKLAVAGGIGLLACRLTVEGPLVKEKSSFMLSGRRTYGDIFLKLDPNDGGNDLYFYDVNAKVNYRINERNRVFLSGYFGRDRLRFFDQYSIDWGNTTGTMRLNHLFSPKLFANFSLIYTDYFYDNSVLESETSSQTFKLASGIESGGAKADFSFYPHPQHQLRWGWESFYHHFIPGEVVEASVASESFRGVPRSNAWAHALYVSHRYEISPKVLLEYGLRGSLFQNIGPHTTYSYNADYQLVDSISHSKGKLFHSQGGLAPRTNLRFLLSENTSIKLGFHRNFQYLQLLRNSTQSFTSLDIWLPSNPNIHAQRADQVSGGYFHTLGQGQWAFSIEGYYKWLAHQVDFVDHARILQNPYIASQLRAGTGKAYGVEILLRKQKGNLKGWISYTWSRSLRKIAGINGGAAYPTPFDKPHDVSIVLMYQAGKRWELASNWQLSSGGAVTLPVGSFEFQGNEVPIYSSRNGERLPLYHRLDLSATLHAKAHRKNRSSWVFSIYNAYYRKNALSINVGPRLGVDLTPVRPEVIVLNKTWLLAVVPSITYNFNF